MANLFLIFVIFSSLGVKGLEITCPEHITRFAYGALSTKYYDCTDRVGMKPILRECNNNNTYLANEQVCEHEFAHARVRRDVEIEQEMLLGRLADLGDFYNAKTNQFYTGISLWNHNTIVANRYRTSIPNTKTEFFSAKTAYSRMSHMDISAEIKLSFLGGLIQVKGSASYLRDSAESENQVNFDMAYHSTTHAWTLPTDTPIDNRARCDTTDATHVVSSVVHGMGANFIYKRYVKSAESAETVSGFLSVAVKSIPGMVIDGKASLDVTGEQEKFFESIDISLYGDFVLDYQPTTFDQSIKLYQMIPQKLGTPPDYNGAGKVKVTLTPKSFYCKKSDSILVGISKQLLSRVSVALDEMQQTQIKISGLLRTDPATKFLHVKRNIDNVRKAMVKFHSNYQSELQTILPQIRGGGGNGETDLIDLLQKYNQSPLRFSAASNFLTNRAREINAINTVLGRFTGARNLKVVDYEQATAVISLLKTPVVVIFDLNILQTDQVTSKYLSGGHFSEKGMWFNQPNEIGMIGRKLREYKDFVQQNVDTLIYGKDKTYLVRIDKVKANAPSVNILAIKNARYLSKNFTTPLSPTTPQVLARAHDTITIMRPSTDNAFVTGVEVRYWEFGHGNKAKKMVFPNNLGPNMIVLGLKPTTVYRFTTRFVTEAGISPSSPLSHPIPTLPCTPPLHPHVVHKTSTTVSLAWTEPTVVGWGVTINGYEVQISCGDYHLTKHTPSPGTSFSDLDPATIYNIEVKATSPSTKLNTSEGYIEADHHSNAAVMQFVTPPSPPEKLIVNNVGYTTIDVMWSRDTVLAPGSTATGFLLQHTEYNATTSTKIPGANVVSLRLPANVFAHTISGLQEGKTYGLKIKIETSVGNSAYSTARIFKTKMRKSDMERVKDSVIAAARSDFNKEIQKNMNTMMSQASAGQVKVQQSVNDVQSKYDRKKQLWPAGSYCIFKDGACPPNFQADYGYIKGIQLKDETVWSVKDVSFGDSRMGLDKVTTALPKGANGWSFPNNYGELVLATCCK